MADDGEGDEGASAALLYFFVVLLLVLICGVQRPAVCVSPTLRLRVQQGKQENELVSTLNPDAAPNTQPKDPTSKNHRETLSPFHFDPYFAVPPQQPCSPLMSHIHDDRRNFTQKGQTALSPQHTAQRP